MLRLLFGILCSIFLNQIEDCSNVQYSNENGTKLIDKEILVENDNNLIYDVTQETNLFWAFVPFLIIGKHLSKRSVPNVTSRFRSLGFNDEQYPQGKFYVEEMMAGCSWVTDNLHVGTLHLQ